MITPTAMLHLALLSLLLPSSSASKPFRSRSHPAGGHVPHVRSPLPDPDPASVPAPVLVGRTPANKTILEDRAGLSLTVGVCLALTAQLDISASACGLASAVQAQVDACLCVDAAIGAEVNNGKVSAGAAVKVTVQVAAAAGGAVAIGGAPASEIQQAVQNPGSISKWPVFGNRCTVPLGLLANSEPDFTKGCCGRKCREGYTMKNLLGVQFCDPICPVYKPVYWTNPKGVKLCVADCPASKPLRQLDGTCVTTCSAGTEIRCNGLCLPKTEYTCPSGVSVPKRKRSRFDCPAGKSLCPTSSISVGTTVTANAVAGWECIDTQSDIESCGGCPDPSMLGGQGFGADCTALPGIDVVSCRTGACRVHSCQTGWELSADKSKCVRAHADEDESLVDVQAQQQLAIMARRS